MDLAGLAGGSPAGVAGVPDLGRKQLKVAAMVERGGVYSFHLIDGKVVTGAVIGACYTAVHQDQEKAVVVPTVMEVGLMHKDAGGAWQVGSSQDSGEQRVGVNFPHVTHWEVHFDPSEAAEQSKKEKMEAAPDAT